MKKRTKKILAWVGGIIGALLIAATILWYYTFLRPFELFSAMRNGDKEKILYLINEKGISKNIKYFYTIRVIDHYLVDATPDMAEFLLQNGFDPIGEENNRYRSLLPLIFLNRHDLLEILFQHGVSANMPLNRLLPLDIAVLGKNCESAKVILKYGGAPSLEVNHEDILQNVLSCHQPLLTKKYIEAGADPKKIEELEKEVSN